MEKNLNSPNSEKKILLTVYAVLVLICCVVGPMMNSFGLFADGVLSLLLFSELIRDGRKDFKPSRIISVVGVILGAYVTFVGFFNLSSTIGYLDNSVSIYVYPLLAITLFGRFVILGFSEKGTPVRGDAIFGLCVTVLVILGTVLTFFAAHYFEPAVAVAVGVYAVYRGIRNIFRPTEYTPVEALTEDEEEVAD